MKNYSMHDTIDRTIENDALLKAGENMLTKTIQKELKLIYRARAAALCRYKEIAKGIRKFDSTVTDEYVRKNVVEICAVLTRIAGRENKRKNNGDQDKTNLS